MANIPKSYQFPNKYYVDLSLKQPVLLPVLMQVIYRLRVSRITDASRDTIANRLIVDCSPIAKAKDVYGRRTVREHLFKLCQCNILMKVNASQKSWLYKVNPHMYHKLRKAQVAEYDERYAELHEFADIFII